MGAIFGAVFCRDIDLHNIQNNLKGALAFRYCEALDISQSDSMLLGSGGWAN